ncbi:hypothetical protein OROMI_009271 [Orobanche minor]
MLELGMTPVLPSFSGNVPAALKAIFPSANINRLGDCDVVLLICVTKVAKSAFDKALAKHEDIDDAVGSEELTERDHGVDLQQPPLIKIDSSNSHQK